MLRRQTSFSLCLKLFRLTENKQQQRFKELLNPEKFLCVFGNINGFVSHKLMPTYIIFEDDMFEAVSLYNIFNFYVRNGAEREFDRFGS